jgi:lipid II:glycine glycyltransferase (peptidoglycan interpeptide bridge formation enzyme)
MTRPTAGVATFDPRDDAAWDALVANADPGSYLQLSGWARVKAVNGWSSTRLLAGAAAPIGAQILVRRPRPLPWAFAYAPRGPVATTWTADAIDALTQTLRSGIRGEAGRVSHILIEP